MSKMLTAVAQMFRSEMRHRMVTGRAKRIFKRSANRSERYVPIPVEEYADVDEGLVPFYAEGDESCSCCGRPVPSHLATYVLRVEPEGCGCCWFRYWVPHCPDCVRMPDPLRELM